MGTKMETASKPIAKNTPPKPFKLKDGSVGGDGPTEEWLAATWEEKLRIIYGDRT